MTAGDSQFTRSQVPTLLAALLIRAPEEASVVGP